MSSQIEREIPFLISKEQDQFRLVELPAELVDLLASADPPRLHFKSSETGHAVLCSANKAFELRQVQTSNSVHITKPIENSESDSSIPTQSGIVSISQCGSTLELIGTSKESAAAYLKSVLPVYKDSTDDVLGKTDRPRSKAEIFSNIPLSEDECEKDWQQLCAFEMGEPANSYLPSPRLIVKAWSDLLANAILDSIDLTQAITKPKLNTLLGVIEGFPQPLLVTLVARMQTPSNRDTIEFDKSSTVSFTGTQLIYDLGEVDEDEFYRQWHNMLPEKWRTDARKEELPVTWLEKKGSKISIAREKVDERLSGSSAETANPGKRKWHDKFKQVRKGR